LTKFAFIIHPLKLKDAARKYPILKYVPDPVIAQIMRRKSPMMASKITGIQSSTGATTEGWFIGCPLTPSMMMNDVELAYDRIVACAKIAEELGAEIIGLGAFTSVVGDGGITVAQRSNIAVTTGNSYTVATAIEGTLQACEMLNVELPNATLAVIGATGSIGKTCAIVLGRQFGRTIVIGRDPERTAAVAAQVHNGEASTDIASIRQADAIITVTSSDAEVVLPEHLKPGAIVCDVARPRDVSVRVASERPDVLVIEGGVVAVPGDVNFNFDFGFPPKTAYACMSETMMLALDGRPESFTLGKDVTVEQVDETLRLAQKHGFKLAGFRSFERAVSNESIERARQARGVKAVIQVPMSADVSAPVVQTGR
jgi:fatty aldehyde-generating acyl-ACP reductase